MGYLTKNFDESEQNLFIEAWSLISHNHWVTLQNLTSLLVAIDKIFIKHNFPETVEYRQFGGLTSNGDFQITDEGEVILVYHHFTLFNKNKQLLNE